MCQGDRFEFSNIVCCGPAVLSGTPVAFSALSESFAELDFKKAKNYTDCSTMLVYYEDLTTGTCLAKDKTTKNILTK